MDSKLCGGKIIMPKIDKKTIKSAIDKKKKEQKDKKNAEKKSKKDKQTLDKKKKSTYLTEDGQFKECTNKHIDESIANIFEKCTIL